MVGEGWRHSSSGTSADGDDTVVIVTSGDVMSKGVFRRERLCEKWARLDGEAGEGEFVVGDRQGWLMGRLWGIG